MIGYYISFYSHLQVVSALRPCGPNEEGEMRVVPCFLNLIDEISSVRTYFNEDLRSYDNRMEVYQRIQVQYFIIIFMEYIMFAYQWIFNSF